ncbi:MAG TPA: lipopolysaccharide assembly protein LapA domain-containing protein [Burkholderiaceae bacterium]|nr:lipopolysaccharide assembly protein LapA domain-containing protein [Burkholderiaceae bacterium]
MKLVAWLLKLGFFLLVLWFALKNTTPVPVRFNSELVWEHVPLIVVMLVCVAIGALLGALALSLPIYKMRREVAQLRRLSPLQSSSESSAERMANAARQSGAVAELGTGERT